MCGFLVLVVWASDVGAYLVGRVIGGPRLAPAISPGKTWSGAVGGLLGAACVGLAVAGLHGWRHGTLGSLGPLGFSRAATIAAGLSVLGQAGDLAEILGEALLRGEGFGVADSRPWRAARPAGRRAGGAARGGTAGLWTGTWDSAVAMNTPQASPRTVSLLGSTGSVGTQTIDLLLAAPPGQFRVRALVAGRNAALLAEQAVALGAELAVVSDPAAYAVLKQALAGTRVRAAAGATAVAEAAALDADWTMAAITGAAGLAPTLAAIRRGGAIALANKEALVCAGDVMLRAVAEAGATLLPVDSEHNAIFQSLADGNRGALERIVLTASGGPFRTLTPGRDESVTPEAALKHPVWSMGAKISIDSRDPDEQGAGGDRGGAAVRPGRSRDRGTGAPAVGDPRHGLLPATAACWPSSARPTCASRSPTPWPGPRGCRPRRGGSTWSRWRGSISTPRTRSASRPCALAREALRAGGGAPTILSAANEVAVDAFLHRRIGFLDIAETAARVLDRIGPRAINTLEDVVAVDACGAAGGGSDGSRTLGVICMFF